MGYGIDSSVYVVRVVYGECFERGYFLCRERLVFFVELVVVVLRVFGVRFLDFFVCSDIGFFKFF